MILKVILIISIVFLLLFLLFLLVYIHKKKHGIEISKIQLYVSVIGIFISVLSSLYSGISVSTIPSEEDKDNSIIEGTTVSDNKNVSMQNEVITYVEEESTTNNIDTNNTISPQNTDPLLPSDGSCNISFVGKGLDLSGCKITYIKNNNEDASFNEVLISNNYDGGWYNDFFPRNEELYFLAWKNNELIGSSYGTPIQGNVNHSVFIFSKEEMGIPVILKFEGKDGLNILDCMITITINNSSTLQTAITESYNGTSLLFFVKSGNYEIDCWKDNILISKANWYFDDAFSINTIFFFPLD